MSAAFSKFYFGLAWACYILSIDAVAKLLRLPMGAEHEADRAHIFALGIFFMATAAYFRAGRVGESERTS